MSSPAPNPLLDRLAEAVFARRPALKQILSRHGRQTLAEYAQAFGRPAKPAPPARSAELIEGILRQIRELNLGFEKNFVAGAIRENYFALTGDHHGPLGHPFFFTGDLLAALAAPQAVLMLATSNVSLNNSSRPRGFVYHGRGPELGHLNLLPSTHGMAPVYAALPYSQPDIDRIKNQPPARPLLDILTNPAVINQPRYASQVSLINSLVWEKIFAAWPGHPKLICLELEKLAADLLISHHLDAASPIQALILDPAARQTFVDNFHGIPGSFDGDHGTVLFWHLSQRHYHGRRERLRVQGSRFVSLDSDFAVEITPDNLKSLLESGRLLPNTILSLLLLSGYYGLKCLGGFSQTTYLTQAQTLYNRLFLNAGPDPDEHTQALGSDLAAAYLACSDRLAPATGLDLLLYGNGQSWHNFEATAQQLTLAEAFSPLLPEFYRILYPEAQRDAELSGLAAEDILTLLDCRSRIRPLGRCDNPEN